MAKILYAPTKNAIQKTLSAQLLSGATAAASLSNTDGIPNSPGVMVIDRVDANGTATASKREYIQYDGTSGSTVVTLTRNVDGGGTDQDHEVGAIVEFIPDTTWAGMIQDALGTLVTAADSSVVNTTNVVTPTATQTLTGKSIVLGGSNYINASGATISLIKDEDDMASDSASSLATQQSIKAYADSVVNYSNDTAPNINAKCRVYLAANQENLTDNTWVKVNFANESYDIGSDYDTTNKRFTAPVSGYYQVNMVISFVTGSVVADIRYNAGIYVNGSLYAANTVHSSNTNQVAAAVSDVVYIAAGQYIEGYARVLLAGGNTVDIYGDGSAGTQFTFMSIHLLSV